MIPRAVYEQWSAMWAHGHVRDRPWWRIVATGHAHAAGAVRVDGARTLLTIIGPNPAASENALLDWGDVERIDRAIPLPAPPPMPGQVWAWDGVEDAVTYVEASSWQDGVVTGWTIGIGGSTRYVGPAWGGVWPIPGAVLVAGPTPWGRDVPWAEMGVKS